MKKKLLITVLLSCLFFITSITNANSFNGSAPSAPAPSNIWDSPSHKVMTKIYGKFNQENSCWIARDKILGAHYCMRIISVEYVDNYENGIPKKTAYLVTTGEAIEDTAHAYVVGGGRYGFIVYETDGNRINKIIASKPMIRGGDYGEPPSASEFSFVKMGKNKYGWRLDLAHAHQGNESIYTMFYVPYKESIKEVFGLITYNSYYDWHGTNQQITTTRRTVEIQNPTDESMTFYPLNITVSDIEINRDYESSEQVLQPGVYTVYFNSNKQEYDQPNGIPRPDTKYLCTDGSSFELIPNGNQAKLILQGNTYQMTRVNTRTGSTRYDNSSGLSFIGVSNMSTLVNFKSQQSIAGECRNESQRHIQAEIDRKKPSAPKAPTR